MNLDDAIFKISKIQKGVKPAVTVNHNPYSSIDFATSRSRSVLGQIDVGGPRDYEEDRKKMATVDQNHGVSTISTSTHLTSVKTSSARPITAIASKPY